MTGLGPSMGPPLETAAKPLVQNIIYNSLRGGMALYNIKSASVNQNRIYSSLSAGLIIDAQKAFISQNQIYNNLNTNINILSSCKNKKK